MKKLYILFFLLLIFAFGLLFVFRQGWYPVALVNNQLLWGWAYEETYATIEKYYTKEASTYNLPEFKGQNSDQFRSDLKLATLNTIIDNMLITDGLYAMKGDDEKQLVNEKLSVYLDDEKIASAASALFNLSVSDFLDTILAPQARREIITETLLKEGKQFDEWLSRQRSDASVTFFISEYVWKPEGVRIREE